MNNLEIKKVIIPIAGLGARFLPLSKVLPKELWPLADKPIIHYILEEVKKSGIRGVIFVVNPDNQMTLNYFKDSPKIEKILKERGKNELLTELKNLKNFYQDFSFSFVVQKQPLGNGHAVLMVQNKIKKENMGLMFGDDVFDSKIPCLLQLIKVFKSYQAPVIGLYKIPKKRISCYGVVEVEKISNRLYRIKKIIEKPKTEKAPSNFAIFGRYILTPDIFDYLKIVKPGKDKEFILADALNDMAQGGKTIYGYEFEGKWLECGNKLSWLKSFFYYVLKYSQYRKELKKYLKEI